MRNELQNYLKILGDLAIEDLVRRPENEEEFLEECFSESGALFQYAMVSKGILQSRYSALFQESIGKPTLSPATDRSGVKTELLADSCTGQYPNVHVFGDIYKEDGLSFKVIKGTLVVDGTGDLFNNTSVIVTSPTPFDLASLDIVGAGGEISIFTPNHLRLPLSGTGTHAVNLVGITEFTIISSDQIGSTVSTDNFVIVK